MLNKIFQFRKNGAGFTLLEVLTSTFVLSLGVVGVFVVVSQTTAFTQVTSSRLTATYLAQEGIEIIKNIRDTNLLKIHKGTPDVNWFNGLTDCGSGCEADYKTMILSPYGGGRYLNIDQDHFYSYSPPVLLSPCSPYGDLNDDGFITSADGTIIMLCIIGLGQNCERGDVNGDKNINVLDLGQFNLYLGCTINTFPVCPAGSKKFSTTIFKRKITIFDTVDLDVPPDGIIDKMKISVEVSWAERGKTHKVAVQEHLYKWWR